MKGLWKQYGLRSSCLGKLSKLTVLCSAICWIPLWTEGSLKYDSTETKKKAGRRKRHKCLKRIFWPRLNLAMQSFGLTELTTYQLSGEITRAGTMRVWRVTGAFEIIVATRAIHPKLKELFSYHKIWITKWKSSVMAQEKIILPLKDTHIRKWKKDK